MQIADKVDPILPESEIMDDEGQILDIKDIDEKWSTKYKEPITFHSVRAAKSFEVQVERETPLTLLTAAYNKLTHKDMDLTNIKITDYDNARSKAAEIVKKADELESQIFQQYKKIKKLVTKEK